MLKQAQLPNYTGDARDWTPILRRYQESDHGRAVLEVIRVLAACAWRFGINAGAIDILPRIAGFAACAAEKSLSKSGAHL